MYPNPMLDAAICRGMNDIVRAILDQHPEELNRDAINFGIKPIQWSIISKRHSVGLNSASNSLKSQLRTTV